MRTALVWAAAAILTSSAAAIFVISNKFQSPPQAGNFQLEAVEANGRIRLAWNPHLGAVRRADSGMLEARDGDKFESYRLEPAVLRRGSLDYIYRSGDVLLTVKLNENGAATSAASIRTVAAVTPPVVAPQPAPAPARKPAAHKASKPVKPAPKKSRFRRIFKWRG